ncbi:MAG TPA: hypothetical protein VNZ64_04860 [Candidatus Acidoferrum sp.]|nr:hypothetical protein [Candidatus Acidoferrum sp.]
MQAFDPVHQAVRYPPDRRFRVWIDARFVLAFAVIALVPVAFAWGHWYNSAAGAGNSTRWDRPQQFRRFIH